MKYFSALKKKIVVNITNLSPIVILILGTYPLKMLFFIPIALKLFT